MTWASIVATNNDKPIIIKPTIINQDTNEEYEKKVLPKGKFIIASKHVQTIILLRLKLKLKQTDVDKLFSLPKNTCATLEKINSLIDEKIYSKVFQGLSKRLDKQV
jgi:hypothetical protein